jgi:hypothetical protein
LKPRFNTAQNGFFDSGRPIPEGDEARTLIEELQQDRLARVHGQVCV